jgi:hypothetical protein
LPKKNPPQPFKGNAFNGHTSGLEDFEGGLTAPDLDQEDEYGQNQFYKREFRVVAGHPIPAFEGHDDAQMWRPNDKVNRFQTMVFPSPKDPASRDQALYLTKAVDVVQKRTAMSMQHVAKVLGRVVAFREFNLLCDISLESTMVDEVKLWDDALSELGRQVGTTCSERGVLIERVRQRVLKLFDFSYCFSSVVMSFLTDSRQQTAELEDVIMRLQNEKELAERHEGIAISDERLQVYSDHCDAVDSHSSDYADTKGKIANLQARLEEHSKDTTSTLEYEQSRIQYRQLLQNMEQGVAARKRQGGMGLKELGDAFLAIGKMKEGALLNKNDESTERLTPDSLDGGGTSNGDDDQEESGENTVETFQTAKEDNGGANEGIVGDSSKKKRFVQEDSGASSDDDDDENEDDLIGELPNGMAVKDLVRKFGTVEGVELVNSQLDKLQLQVKYFSFFFFQMS